MKVLLLTNRFDRGGVTNVMLDLVRNLPDHALQVGAMYRSGFDHEILEEFPNAVVGPLAAARAARSSDVVHVQQRIAASFCSVIAPRVRRIEHVHNQFSNLRWISFRSAELIAVSESVSRTLQVHYPHASPAHVIPNGVPDFAVEHGSARQTPTRLHLVAAGRLAEQKNPLKFLALIDALRTIAPDVRGTWVGSGELQDAFLYERSRRQLEDVVSHYPWMNRSGLAALISNSTALVITSTWEGLPLVALESLSLGIPVITTECGEIADLVRTSGSGMVWSQGDEHQFASVIEMRLLKDWGTFSLAARELYLKSFTLRVMSERVRNVYEA